MGNTILITVDALRPDHIELYGYDRDTMPVLNEIAENGTIFNSAYSNGPYTAVSVPSFHTSRILGYSEASHHATIASELSKQDIYTSVVGTNTGWKSHEANLGFDEYFDLHYHSPHAQGSSHSSMIDTLKKNSANVLQSSPRLFHLAKSVYSRSRNLYRRIRPRYSWGYYPSTSDVTDHVIEWLGSRPEQEFFLWVHYMEGHSPYGLPDDDPAYTPKISDDRSKEITKKGFQNPGGLTIKEYRLLVDLYDSNLRYCSNHIERLFNYLKESGLWDETTIIFSSDHGEEFFEHGMFWHHNFPYDELIHVPLLISGPDIENNRIEPQRELLDLAPTILDLHGIESPDSFQGQNLFEGGSREVIAVGSHAYDGRVVAGRWDDWKYIWTDDGEYLYDLERDPREEKNIVGKNNTVRNSFRKRIPEEIFEAPPKEIREPEDEVDRSQLEALGYLDMK